MIVLDEQLTDPQIIQLFARWYKGSVRTIKELRTGTIILDDAVPTLLRRVRDPTFVTINHTDYWRVIPPSPDYCIICLRLPQSRASLASNIVRDILRLPQFRTKHARMGYVLLASLTGLENYLSK